MLNNLQNYQGYSPNLSQVLSFFKTDIEDLQRVLLLALSKGGEYSDLLFEYTHYNNVRLQDSIVDKATNITVLGVGIRVIKDDQIGYSYTQNLDLESIKEAAVVASEIAYYTQRAGIIVESPLSLKNTLSNISNYPILNSWENVPIQEKINHLNRINEGVFNKDNRIIKCNISFNNETTLKLIATSDGSVNFDYQPMSQIAVSVVAEENGKKERASYDLAGRYGFEFFDGKNIDTLVSKPVEKSLRLFEATQPAAGEMEVVMAAGSSGVLLHEAIGHGLEADFNRKKVSLYADRLNTKIADESVTIIDDPTLLNSRGSINMDDEGTISQKTVLVENGILKSYLHDKISAKYYNVKPTGNGRRESYKSYPMPRMTSTYMLNGNKTKDEIINSVKKGVYAIDFSNGQVMIGAGDFTFYVKYGYMIEDGRLTQPIKDFNVIGNGPQVLADIQMVGNDLKIAEGGWTCGKDGQSLPVSQGMPTTKVSKLVVSGGT